MPSLLALLISFKVTLNLDKFVSVEMILSLPPSNSTNLLKSRLASFLLAFKIANKTIIKIITYN